MLLSAQKVQRAKVASLTRLREYSHELQHKHIHPTRPECAIKCN